MTFELSLNAVWKLRWVPQRCDAFITFYDIRIINAKIWNGGGFFQRCDAFIAFFTTFELSLNAAWKLRWVPQRCDAFITFYDIRFIVECSLKIEVGSPKVWCIRGFFMTFELSMGRMWNGCRFSKRCDAFIAFLWHSNYHWMQFENWGGFPKGVTHLLLFMTFELSMQKFEMEVGSSKGVTHL